MNPEKTTVSPNQTQKRLTVIFIHGMYHDWWCWKLFFDELNRIKRAPGEEGHREIQFIPAVLTGHDPDKPSPFLWFVPLGRYVKDVLDQISVVDGPVVLVGHSMGALVAAAAAQKVPVAGLVLLAPLSPRSFREVNCRLFIHHPWDLLASFATFSPKRAIRDWRICHELFFSERMPEDTVKEHQKKLQAESYVATVQMLIGRPLFWPRYRPLNGTPVLILGAAGDQCVCRYCVKWVANRLGVKAEILPNLAHDMMLDLEWKVVFKRLYGWLVGLP